MKYSIVYADPPWNYSSSFSESIPSRAKQGASYSAMRMVDIYDYFETNNIELADDCYLFLWSTSSLLPEALHTLRSWGFDFKVVAFTWVKKNKHKDSWFWGMGSYTRCNPEFCLMGIRGKPKPISHSVHSIVDTPIEEHSKKPDCVRDKIVELCGDLPRIELFARQKVDGWDSVGNQLEES